MLHVWERGLIWKRLLLLKLSILLSLVGLCLAHLGVRTLLSIICLRVSQMWDWRACIEICSDRILQLLLHLYLLKLLWWRVWLLHWKATLLGYQIYFIRTFMFIFTSQIWARCNVRLQNLLNGLWLWRNHVLPCTMSVGLGCRQKVRWII